MRSYQRKSQKVKAVQWMDESPQSDFFTVTVENTRHQFPVMVNASGRFLCIKTFDGWDEIRPGDWIVVGQNGETRGCSDNKFRLLYEPEFEEGNS